VGCLFTLHADPPSHTAPHPADLVQLLVRRAHFARSMVALLVPHHWLSLAWFGAWMALLAPRDAGGAPIWDTVRAGAGRGGRRRVAAAAAAAS
jgi:hypothetical protein